MNDEREDAATPGEPGVPPAPPATLIGAPTPDVAPADETLRLPGEHRGGFSRLPTAPVQLTRAETASVPTTWIEPQRPTVGLAGWALGFSILGLAIACVVGWGFPIGVGSAITAIVALRRPLENRAVAVWALVLGILSVLYSAGWLYWAAQQANIFA
ncbi:hypothetical protein [Microbacterium sp. zg-YB36]|uniref:hypothetical protein n=1 Tax=Microbacterium sp. zg-YB36 TaxID=2969407 RepID=UPI00214C8DDA|nr:hypothetical protein [Microbacterium sp. zg-YB36]MDL5352391.1 hypothetical protein [Microbacterium sp. zg-YB36]